jgi:hypothetical protein
VLARVLAQEVAEVVAFPVAVEAALAEVVEVAHSDMR